MTIDIEKLKALALAATRGPWNVDTIKSEGEYGTDEDGGVGFTAYIVADNEGRPLMDSLNRDDSDIHIDTDGDEHYAWDELAKRDAAFIAAANPATVLDLIAEVERLRAATQPAPIPALTDEAKDAARFRKAIAHEDSAESLYAATLNHAPDGDAIRREFDASHINAGQAGKEQGNG